MDCVQTYPPMESLALSSKAGTAAGKVTGIYGRELSGLALDGGWRGNFLLDWGAGGGRCFLVEPSPSLHADAEDCNI